MLPLLYDEKNETLKK